MYYEQLLSIVAQRKELEKQLELAKASFEQSIALEKAQLEDLVSREELERSQILLYMKAGGIDSEKLNGHVITRNYKVTNQIKDARKLYEAILVNEDKILALGVKADDLHKSFTEEIIITNKKLATDLVNNFEKMENILLDGVEKKVTEFLTVN